MVVLENISKTFKNGDKILHANKNINLVLDKGLIAIVGKSGSGKTTLLNIIGGLLKPSEGKIIMDGEELTKYDEKNLSFFRNQQIGFIFQSFYLEESYTAYENVELPLIIGRVESSVRKMRVDKALKIVDMANKANVIANNLSGGEKQRVAIARAIVNKPTILLCDEPTGNLDKENSDIIFSYLRKLADSDILIILVTHDLEYAKKSDQIIEISDGEII